MILDRLAREVEALIFASDEPLSISQLCEYTGSGEDSIHQALDRINRAFRDQHHALGIIEVAGGFRIATESEFGDVVSQLFEGKKPGKLSRAA
ncbi:MAG: SMC-Scp complex subunit ScpB, partial [Candidatus Fermentibacteraceae bacterium]|nr:SMC-Scp complex subunit ScpB [Candidatus Fermentibacteraceae bacterium]